MKERTRYLLGAALLILSCLMIAVGITNGEMAVVLKKAVNVCLECIGIG
jgi:hypothetical protein